MDEVLEGELAVMVWSLSEKRAVNVQKRHPRHGMSHADHERLWERVRWGADRAT